MTKIQALIFDLDGVVTQTQKLHKDAWESLFAAYFKSRGEDDFMADEDYKIYIDGKPRYEGVQSFLKSRHIDIPFGEFSDSPGDKTVCSLGNKKNEIFNQMIEKGGVEVYEESVEKIKYWRKRGLKTAIVSSSKNCKKIIDHSGITDLFDVRVDGMVSEERGLQGKPNPDIFLEAAKDLGAQPEKCVVFEDAISGVQAGQRGFFGLVVGVDRFNNEDALRKNGADIIINNFNEIDLFNNSLIENYFNPKVPMVFSAESDLFKIFEQKKPVFFLDYDGTLSPIVKRPEDAIISDEMRDTINELAKVFTVAIVTGRDKEDVQNMIKLDNLIYAGSHGYIISGPDGLFKEHEKSETIINELDEIEKDLYKELEGKAEGVQVDRKRYAIGLHYRNASEKDVPFVYEVVDKMLKKHKGYKKGEGKKIVEIKPDIDWHKGKAVLWILEALGLERKKDIIPVFIGDDVTDEDAFKALQNKGVGIIVEYYGQKTAAKYALKNIWQVGKLFRRLIKLYKTKE